MPRALSATKADAPQSTSSVPFAVSMKKQVLNRPPEPKASPDPTTVTRIAALSLRARARGDGGVPALDIAEIVRDCEFCRLHEIDADETGNVGN